jgi:hypothetical protein
MQNGDSQISQVEETPELRARVQQKQSGTVSRGLQWQQGGEGRGLQATGHKAGYTQVAEVEVAAGEASARWKGAKRAA